MINKGKRLKIEQRSSVAGFARSVQELMTVAAIGAEVFRTGMVVVVQTAGDFLNHHPHTHAIAPRGGWDLNGDWVPIVVVHP